MVGVTVDRRARTSPRATGAGLVVVCVLIVQMVLSLAFPRTIPRLVLLPRPATEVEQPRFVGCEYDITTFDYEQRLLFWIRDAGAVGHLDPCVL